MSSFARKMGRKVSKAGEKGVKKAERTAGRTQASLICAYAHANIKSTMTRKTALRHLSWVFLYAMHRDAGFGAKKGKASRLFRLRDKMQSVFDCIVSKNVTIQEIEKFLRDEIKIDVDIISCDPKANWYRKVGHRAVQEMEAAFLMALVDEFGYGKKRLEQAYIYCAKLSDEIASGKLTYAFICNEIERVMLNQKAAA
jgi:hypothetical protein